MTQQTAISAAVKERVRARDSVDGHCCCVLCGSPEALPNAHIVRRSQGGLGTERNVVALCAYCHYKLDEGKNRDALMETVVAHIKTHYPDWTPESVTYRKWEAFEC